MAARTDFPRKSAYCAEGDYAWRYERAWRLVILDDLTAVPAGGTLRTEAKPFAPWTVKVTGDRRGLPSSTVLAALEQETRASLAADGTRSSENARKMSATFPDAAQALYYRGVRAVRASYTFTCRSDASRNTSGHVLTWETASATTGLVNCLAEPEGNADSVLARQVLTRCPSGSPARGRVT
ncbi:hypothetical protein [Streptomyces koyangensis]